MYFFFSLNQRNRVALIRSFTFQGLVLFLVLNMCSFFILQFNLFILLFNFFLKKKEIMKKFKKIQASFFKSSIQDSGKVMANYNTRPASSVSLFFFFLVSKDWATLSLDFPFPFVILAPVLFDNTLISF